MQLDTYLAAIIILALIFAPLFILLRTRTTLHSNRIKKLTKTKKQLGLDAFFVFSIIVVSQFLTFGFLFLLEPSFHEWNATQFQIMSTMVVISLLISFSGGIYLMGIILEQYLLAFKVKKTKPLINTFNFYRGPFSHDLIYVGGALNLMLVSFFEWFSSNSLHSSHFYPFAGFIFGSTYAYGQIRNNTWRGQLLILVSLLSIYLFSSYTYLAFNPLSLPFNSFFATFIVVLIAILALKYLKYRVKKEKYKYDTV